MAKSKRMLIAEFNGYIDRLLEENAAAGLSAGTVALEGVHTKKETDVFMKNFEDLLKDVSGDKNLKVEHFIVRIYCATCGSKFKTFMQLQKHLKATRHRAIPKTVRQ